MPPIDEQYLVKAEKAIPDLPSTSLEDVGNVMSINASRAETCYIIHNDLVDLIRKRQEETK